MTPKANHAFLSRFFLLSLHKVPQGPLGAPPAQPAQRASHTCTALHVVRPVRSSNTHPARAQHPRRRPGEFTVTMSMVAWIRISSLTVMKEAVCPETMYRLRLEGYDISFHMFLIIIAGPYCSVLDFWGESKPKTKLCRAVTVGPFLFSPFLIIDIINCRI